jgi:ABC-type polysaccharide/polyol phosphate export permease
MINFKQLVVISKYFFLYVGNQSVFNLFWPFFRTFAPIFLGFITFGQILEIDSNSIPYINWVLTGVSIWIILGSSFSNGILLFSSNTRRIKFQNLKLNGLFVVFSQSIPNIILSIMALLLNVPLISKQKNFHDILISTMGLVVLYFLVLILSLAVSFMVGILSALMRDIRIVSQFVTQYLLLASPIFYLKQMPDSTIETIFYNLNPMVSILEIQRYLVFRTPLDLNITQTIILTCLILMSILLINFTNKVISKLLWCFNIDFLEEIDENI